MTKLETKYDRQRIEEKLQITWEKASVYKWNGVGDFVIDTPPPTISGVLHIGHIFSYCHTDFIARYQRMQGKDVFYPMGFDDNGLPTERLVEKKYKIKAHNLSKEEFIKLCCQTSAEHRKEFRKLFQTIGLSIDWDLEYHTISNDCRTLSQMSFLDLYQKGELYQKEQPMLWDPIDQTAIAQAEIEEKEFSSYMNYVKFKSQDKEEFIIATTRPELLPACVAVLVHPDDSRYQHLRGKFAITPIFEAEVPIIPDENVKMDKGSGAVMCCTFGDEMDIEWWRSHSLKTKIIINKYGKICNLDKYGKNKEINSLLEGLKIKDARAKIIELLSGHLERREEIRHQVKCAERSGTPLEILPTKQWFIKIIKHKEELLKRAQECNWHPENRRITIEQWIENLKWDWCISRQRYFGIPLPVWYSKRRGEEGKILIPELKQLPVDPSFDLPIGYTKDEIIPELDVMDTWATSSISPALNARFINDNYQLDNKRKLLPATLRPQAHEIIRTWAFYTIVKSHLHTASIPWENLMISGWCLAEDKSKMSKSKGNVITPNALLDLYGADVIRCWASHAKLGADTVYSENIMKMGKRLTTKIWNAGKFVANFLVKDINLDLIKSPIDLWIIGKLEQTLSYVSQRFTEFEYSEARSAIEDFFWHDYCDNYLELVKGRAYDQDAKWHESAAHSLSYTFDIILRMFAPFIPFITEEVYNNLYNSLSIHRRGNWPYIEKKIDEQYIKIGEAATDLLKQIRERKSADQVSIKTPIHLTLESQYEEMAEAKFDLKSATNAKTINWQKKDVGYHFVIKDYKYL